MGEATDSPPQDQGISPALPGLLIVGPAVEEIPFHCPQVFSPLLFDVDERPLPPAEGEVLQAGQLEKVLFMIAAHTPSITSAKSILFCNTLMAVFLLCAFIFLMKIVSSPSKADCTLRLFFKI